MGWARGSETVSLVDGSFNPITSANPLNVNSSTLISGEDQTNNRLNSRRAIGIAISGPAPANGAANVTFTAVSAAWTSADITVDVYAELQVDLTCTTITTNVNFTVARKGADGVYYTIATSFTKTTSGAASSLTLSASSPNVADAGAGTKSIWSVGATPGDIIQIVVTPTGAFTGTLSLKGK